MLFGFMSHSDLKLHMKDLNSNFRALTSALKYHIYHSRNRLTALLRSQILVVAIILIPWLMAEPDMAALPHRIF